MAPDVNEELVRAFVSAMRVEYVAKLPSTLDELEATWRLLRERGWEAPHIQALHRQVHHLHGSGAMYGFAALSAVAQPLDMLLGTLTSRATPLLTHEAAELGSLVDELRAAVAQCLGAADEVSQL